MDQAIYDRIRELQRASLFRTKTASGDDRIVDSPFLGGPVASAFERVVRFDEPIVEIARLGVHEIHFAALAFDAVEDGLDAIHDLSHWTMEGAVAVRHMAGGRC